MNILKETQKYLNEVRAIAIKRGEEYTLSMDLGKFKKGETVRVNDIKPYGNDIEVHMSNSGGVEDTFYLDKNDSFEGLD